MFNRNKTGDVKYCFKKINGDIRNLKYLDIAAIEGIFNAKDYRTWSRDFAMKALEDERIIEAIKELPLEKQRTIVHNLVTWKGELITKFDKSFLSDYEIATAAMQHDLVIPMPKKMAMVPDYYEREMVEREVDDYDQLDTNYHLFPLLSDELKIEILGKELYLHPFSGLKEEDHKYILESLPEKAKKDPELATKVCARFPEAYNYLDAETQKNPRVIAQAVGLEGVNEERIKEVIENMTEKEKKELIENFSEWRMTYAGYVPTALNFVFDSKEDVKLLLKDHLLAQGTLEKIKKEHLEDKEFAEYCLNKLDFRYSDQLDTIIEKFPEEFFKDGNHLAKLYERARGVNNEELKKLKSVLEKLDFDEYVKAIAQRPELVYYAQRDDSALAVGKAIEMIDDNKIGSFYNDVSKHVEISREDLLKIYVKNPMYMYTHVKNMDRDFFIEAALQNDNVITSIKNSELKNEVLIAATTVKYLKGNFLKATTDEELDALIAKVKESKKNNVKVEKSVKPRPIHRSRRG